MLKVARSRLSPDAGDGAPMDVGICCGNRFRALLLGGPYDGQDVLVSDEELARGVYQRGGCCYLASRSTRGFPSVEFRWVDPAAALVVVTRPDASPQPARGFVPADGGCAGLE